MNNLEKAIAAARQFGGEAEANSLASWSRDDRHGERMERAKTFAELLVTEQTKDWEAEDWENEHPDRLVKQAEEMLDESPELYGDMFRAMLAFERRMGW